LGVRTIEKRKNGKKKDTVISDEPFWSQQQAGKTANHNRKDGRPWSERRGEKGALWGGGAVHG